MLTALGIIAHIQRDYTTAERYYQQALVIQQMIGDRTGEAGSLMSLGQAARSHGDYSKAAYLIKSAMTIFQSQANLWWEKIGSNELGIIAMLTGNFAAASQHFHNSIGLSQRIGDTVGEAIALLNLGQTTRDQSDYLNAQKLLLQSRVIADQQGDKDLSAQCWSDLAICSLFLREPQQAINSARQAIVLFNELGIKPALTTELCTLAQAYLQTNEYDQAIDHIKQAFDLLEELDGVGPDYPHRDYLTCYQVFDELGYADVAQFALTKAYTILQGKSMKISDPAMRSSFLENVAFNRQIIAIATQNGLTQEESPAEVMR
jgi:tetratricopeptide (TPR) repeat protein